MAFVVVFTAIKYRNCNVETAPLVWWVLILRRHTFYDVDDRLSFFGFQRQDLLCGVADQHSMTLGERKIQ